MSFARYPLYRDSGVATLGDVPAHWSVRRLRTVATLNPSKSEVHDLDRDTLVSFLPMEAIGDDGSLDLSRERPISELEGGYSYFREGDVAVAKITPCFENGKGARMCGLRNGVGFGTTELIVVRPDETRLAGTFLQYLFNTREFRDAGEAHMYGAGGQQRVPDEFVRNFHVALPSVDDQEEIAAFLDRETAKLDALVAEQRRLIALLREKQRAVMSHAVTSGLDANVPTRPSKVDWMGEVPAHWRVLHLARVTLEKCDGPFGSGLKSEHYVDAGVRVVRLQNIRAGLFDDADAAFIDEDYFRRELTRHEVRSGDLLIAGLGDDRNTVGRACVAPPSVEPAMVKADCFRFRLDPSQADSTFVAAQLSAGASDDAGRLATGSTRSRIPLSEMAARRVALPPIAEQRAIMSEAAERTTELIGLMTDAGKAITLLHERRAALISAAVTGQIDVRAAAPAEAIAA